VESTGTDLGDEAFAETRSRARRAHGFRFSLFLLLDFLCSLCLLA
jgi:hypothetical protein